MRTAASGRASSQGRESTSDTLSPRRHFDEIWLKPQAAGGGCSGGQNTSGRQRALEPVLALGSWSARVPPAGTCRRPDLSNGTPDDERVDFQNLTAEIDGHQAL